MHCFGTPTQSYRLIGEKLLVVRRNHSSRYSRSAERDMTNRNMWHRRPAIVSMLRRRQRAPGLTRLQKKPKERILFRVFFPALAVSFSSVSLRSEFAVHMLAPTLIKETRKNQKKNPPRLKKSPTAIYMINADVFSRTI